MSKFVFISLVFSATFANAAPANPDLDYRPYLANERPDDSTGPAKVYSHKIIGTIISSNKLIKSVSDGMECLGKPGIIHRNDAMDASDIPDECRMVFSEQTYYTYTIKGPGDIGEFKYIQVTGSTLVNDDKDVERAFTPNPADYIIDLANKKPEGSTGRAVVYTYKKDAKVIATGKIPRKTKSQVVCDDVAYNLDSSNIDEIPANCRYTYNDSFYYTYTLQGPDNRDELRYLRVTGASYSPQQIGATGQIVIRCTIHPGKPLEQIPVRGGKAEMILNCAASAYAMY